MVRKHPVRTFIAATVLLCLSSAAAMAATAFATTNLNVRAGPGQEHASLDILLRGERVEVDRCAGIWCLVTRPGSDGWVSARYLAPDDPRGGRYDDYDDYDDYDGYDRYEDDFFLVDRPRYRFRSEVCVGGPNVRFCSLN